jgi:pyruvate dehydrogenase E2 component (dihydrolipoamide acetyltransferase)
MIKEIRLPEVGENIESGDIIKVLVSIGDFVKNEEPLVEVETDKAIFEVPSPEQGKITEILIKDGDQIKIDEVMFRIETEAEATAEEVKEETPTEKEPIAETSEKPKTTEKPLTKDTVPEFTEPKTPDKVPPASPTVRRLARELGVDLSNVSGTGPGGRISDEDVKLYVKGVMTSVGSAGIVSAYKPLPDFTQWGEITREPMNKVRKITAESLGHAWNTIPHVTQFDKADITELEAFRKKHKAKVAESGGSLTLTAFLLKVVATALKVHPKFNASINPENGEIIYKNYYNVGVAVDTDRGLLVPVIRNVESKGVAELAVELTKISEAARTKKITPDDLQGGNFTISNLGGIGGTYFTPIVYWPQVAILGVARSVIEPVYDDGEFKPRLMMPLGLSYDHRAIDGADGIRFLRWIINALEDPFLLALED